MAKFTTLISLGLALASMQGSFAQINLRSCTQVMECVRYYESPTCGTDGTRHVCMSWETSAGCAALAAGDTLNMCLMHDFSSITTLVEGDQICVNINGGSSYTFGIRSMRNPGDTTPTMGTGITLAGYSQNGELAVCLPWVNHCTAGGSNDFRITISASVCPVTTVPPCSCPEWSNWSGCSATCGVNAMRTRTRGACSANCNPAPTQTETGLCPGVPVNCPRNGGYTHWSEWSACPVTCNLGVTERTRTCTNPTPAFGGHDCVGSSIESKHCFAGVCPVVTTQAPGTTQAPVTDRRQCRKQARKGVCKNFVKRQRRQCVRTQCPRV
ncbi:thrombospondin-1-like [Watersipora subatra]|uniref:thrombospondin-1-like n=1 Tax=Watersipora subatra TaxID=2589382 RepID=UPI00355B4FBF